MIDCHCHLAAEEFDKDFDAVVQRAKEAGVIACLVVTEHFNEFDKTLELSKKHPGFLFPCAGVHPVQHDRADDQTTARSVQPSDLEHVEDWIRRNQSELAAVGEIGLDLTPRFIRTPSDPKTQDEIFSKQIEMAKHFDLPVNVHSRSAGKHVIECLIRNGATKVLLHAFSGNYKSAVAGITAGFYFSVPPSSILSDQKKSLFEKIPLEQLLLETDSPVLGPVKDERNEPANIRVSVDFLASLKKVTPEVVMKQTTQNSLKLFPKLAHFVKL